MQIRTAEGWRPLRRMTVADLREASRRLPGAARAEIAELADVIFFESRSAPRSAPTLPEARPTGGQQAD